MSVLHHQYRLRASSSRSTKLPLELYQVAEALERILRRLADAPEGVVQKVVVPGYTENRQSRTSKGIPRFECYPVLNHAGEPFVIRRRTFVSTWRPRRPRWCYGRQARLLGR
jgi:hypothetical protein